MITDDIFVSAVRSADDRAGVFEYDGETGYFYLYHAKGEITQKVIAAIRVCVGTLDFKEQDVVVRWDQNETRVGLLIRGQLWAVFDTVTGAKLGGDYRAGSHAEFPNEIYSAFAKASEQGR